MGWFDKMFGDRRAAALQFYNAVVTRARAPHWYREGGVADSVDGRFDMIAAVLAIVLLRLEREPAAASLAAQLTERFVDDMDGQLREMGIGDITVGKHMGRMMGMLGGRLGAYRDGLAAGDLDAALIRNLYRGAAPDAAGVAHVRDGLIDLDRRLRDWPLASLAEGALP